jgi:hypothetical protein
VGAEVRLAEPAETGARRGNVKRATTDRGDARHLRELLIDRGCRSPGCRPTAWLERGAPEREIGVWDCAPSTECQPSAESDRRAGANQGSAGAHGWPRCPWRRSRPRQFARGASGLRSVRAPPATVAEDPRRGRRAIGGGDHRTSRRARAGARAAAAAMSDAPLVPGALADGFRAERGRAHALVLLPSGNPCPRCGHARPGPRAACVLGRWCCAPPTPAGECARADRGVFARRRRHGGRALPGGVQPGNARSARAKRERASGGRARAGELPARARAEQQRPGRTRCAAPRELGRRRAGRSRLEIPALSASGRSSAIASCSRRSATRASRSRSPCSRS